MVTLLAQNNIQKTRTQNTQWKQRYQWKRYRSMTRRYVRHFPPASGRMTPINVCLWRHREHGNSNKRWRQRRFEPSQETGVKAILQVLIYKALYDKSYLGSKTTMTSGEWTCLISFATAPLTCSERGGSEKFKMKIYVSSGIRTHTPPVHDRKVAAP